MVDYGDERLPKRIWLNIYPEPNTGCWLWGASETKKGYGQVHWQKSTWRTHALLYEALVGSRGGLDPDHLCRVRICCNPDHLELVTRAENLARGEGLIWMIRRDRDHCKHGHKFTEENTYDNGKERACRTCRRERQKAYKSRQRRKSL